MSILVNFFGVFLIGFVIWWFWISKPALYKDKGSKIKIIVADGVYQPSRIEIKANTPVELVFFRKDPSPCAEMVIFDSLNRAESLPLGQEKSIALNIPQQGEYGFTCQMQMYRGTLIVEK